MTPFPPSKTTLNEYGFHLVQQFAQKEEIDRISLFVEDISDQQEYQNESSKIKFIKSWRFNSYTNLFRIIRLIRTERPDFVVLNLQFLIFGDKKVAAALGLLIPFFLKISGFKTIVLLHNIMEEVDLSKAGITQNKLLAFVFTQIGNILTRFILQATLVGVTIEKYVDVLVKKYKASNVVLLPHGTFEIPPNPDYSLPEGPFQIMTFGKFGTYKKVEILIEAIKEFRIKNDVPVKVVIAGTDNPNVPGYLEDVKKSYPDVKGLEFTGYVEEEDVPKIFKDSAVVVFPYTSTTGSSGVLHQAGSYGKAAILPNLGDLASLVEEEGYRGVFFNPDSHSSLCEAIEKVLLDPTFRKELEVANYQAASSLGLSDITDWYLIHIFRMLDMQPANQKVKHLEYQET